jgi:hypothetical protein
MKPAPRKLPIVSRLTSLPKIFDSSPRVPGREAVFGQANADAPIRTGHHLIGHERIHRPEREAGARF